MALFKKKEETKIQPAEHTETKISTKKVEEEQTKEETLEDMIINRPDIWYKAIMLYQTRELSAQITELSTKIDKLQKRIEELAK